MSARLVAEFTVDGQPVPQGSKTGFVVGKRAVIVDANKSVLKPWRALVTAAAREAYTGDPVDGPIALAIEFRFMRPKSVKREYPSVAPDLSKLLRAVEDAITDAGLWRDDALVVCADVSKVYAERPGALVRIKQMEPKEMK